MRRIGWLLIGLAFLLGLGGCGGNGEAGPSVYAAASLTEVFPAIDASARYSFGGSDALATQIREGAPADVYAAASARYAEELYREGLVAKPVVFASNRLVAIVPKDNPARIVRVDDVTRPGTKLVVAAAGVPAGAYTRTVLRDLGFERALANVVSTEDDVKGVVAKVATGEADAGFAYATDAAAADDRVRAVELPERSQPTIEYEIAVVRRTKNRRAAEAFVRKVLGPRGRKALAAAGFVVR